MLFAQQSLQTQIIQELKEGPRLLTELVEDLKQKRKGTSKQGVYKAIKSLQNSEVLLVHDHKASLNLQWLTQLCLFSELANRQYLTPQAAGHLANLRQNESLIYKFNNPKNADSFWNHALYTLIAATKETDDLFCYNPHSWFWLVRRHEEANLVDFLKSFNRRYFMTVSGQTPGDSYLTKTFEAINSQYNMLENPLFKENNYHLNIIGNFLIEVWLDHKTANKLEEWYLTTKFVDSTSLIDLDTIVSQKKPVRIKISNKPTKASQIRKTLQSGFVLD